MIGKRITSCFPGFSLLGDDPKTIEFFSFWVDLLAATASFAMVLITSISINLNDKQLKEIKRQWEEEHKPYLTCHLVVHNQIFRLCVTNSSNVVAKDVKISIENFLSKEPLYFNKLKEFLKNQVFLIPPQGNIYFNLLITAYREEEYLPKGYLQVSLRSGNADFGDFILYPSNHAYVIYENDSSEADISNKLDDLNKTIKNKKFL